MSSPEVTMGSYVVWDVETTTRTNYKRKGNPFDPDNYIVMSGWSRDDGPVTGEYFGRRLSYFNDRPAGERYEAVTGKGAHDDWFIKLIAPPPPMMPPKWIVGVNIKYDLLYALRDPDNYAAWKRYVAAGGNVWDCQLAEYLLKGMGQSEHMLSMDEIAPRYGGNLKYDEVKALWDAGVCTTDIDRDLLTRYLCGEGAEHGDIGNTRLIFLGQFAAAKAAGQLKSIELNMGALLCTVEMEKNGMRVDKDLGLRQAEELAIELAGLTVELMTFLPKDLPFDFNWGSGPQKSALIFGGKIRYDAKVWYKDDQGNQIYAKKKVKAYYMDDGSFIPVDDALALDAKADAGSYPLTYGSGKNKGEPKTKMIDVDNLDKPKGSIQDHWYEFPRITEPSDRWKGAKEGVWSVNAKVVEALSNRDIPFLQTLTKVEKLSKDLGTYYITTNEETGEQKGMLTLIQWDKIIHHMLNHTSTVTGRFSSSSPNLQNLPSEGKSVVKTLFISRFPGGKIIQSDFTALEVYVQAILTRCKQLILDLLAGLDMHCVRVSQKTGRPYEEVYQLAVVEQVKEWVKERKGAKVFSFQRAYGAGVKLIAEDTGMDIEDVQALADAEDARYPEMGRYYVDLTEQIVNNSVDSGIVVDHPDIQGLKCHLRKSHYCTPDGKRYSYRQSPAPKFLAEKPASRGGAPASFSPTEIKNYVVQGTGGEWAKAAMWLAIKAFYRTDNLKGTCLLVNQVHDALYCDSTAESSWLGAAILHACMEAASEWMEWRFDWLVPCPVPSETMIGDNMMDEKRPENIDAWKIKVRAIRLRIRELDMDGYKPSFEKEDA